jgi:hypothetical protein
MGQLAGFQGKTSRPIYSNHITLPPQRLIRSFASSIGHNHGLIDEI